MVQSAESRDQVKNNLAAEVLRNTGKVCLAALGNSMLPAIWPGDVLTLQACPFEQISEGEVVLFARDGRFFIHRVLAKVDLDSQRHLIMRGDAMPQNDDPVLPSQVLGKVIAVRREGRELPVPSCSRSKRLAGLLLTAFDHLRSLALRWHASSEPAETSKSNVGPLGVPQQ